MQSLSHLMDTTAEQIVRAVLGLREGDDVDNVYDKLLEARESYSRRAVEIQREVREIGQSA